MISRKYIDWINFSSKVSNHIITYAIPQYGDSGDDLASDYSFEDCVRNIQRYVARAGRNCRTSHDQLDMIKIAHYAQMAYNKLEKERQCQE